MRPRQVHQVSMSHNCCSCLCCAEDDTLHWRHSDGSSSWLGQRVRAPFGSSPSGQQLPPGGSHMGKTPFSRLALFRTRSRDHNAERPFKCHLCPQSFTQSSHLKRHCLSHTGQQPFQCRFCGKTFARSDNRKTHEKSHMRALGRL